MTDVLGLDMVKETPAETPMDRLMDEARELFADVVQRCDECGACTARCNLLEEPGWNVRTVCAESLQVLDAVDAARRSGQLTADAHGMLQHGLAGHHALYRFVRTCLGCNRCTARCPKGLSASTVRAAWRNMLRAGKFIADDETLGLMVDRTWDIFSAFRFTQGIRYDDLPLLHVAPVDAAATGWEAPGFKEAASAASTASPNAEGATQADTLFFPGCTLCSYAPELTRAAFAWLGEHSDGCLLATQCCGSTLEGVGEGARATAWKRRVLQAARDRGVRRVVTVCPGCQQRLEPVAAQVAPEMEFVSLAAVLANAGVRVKSSQLEDCTLPVAVVDSCQDRAGAHGPAIRTLFNQVDSVAFPATGKDAWCCGASGDVNTIDPGFPRACTRRQLQRGIQAGAGTLITACPTCAYTYAFERRTCAAEGDASWQGIGSLNYLEAVFGQRVNWPAVFQSLEDMWAGQHAEWTVKVLSEP